MDNPEMTAHTAVVCYLPITGHCSRSHDNATRFISPKGNSPDNWRISISQRLPKCVFSVQAAKNPQETIAIDIRPSGYTDIPVFPFEIMHCYSPSPARRFNMHGIVRNDIAKAILPTLTAAREQYRVQRYSIA